jgi:hypothetical protein
MPLVYSLFEVRDPEPGVTVLHVSEAGEECWTNYPESRGILNSYSDSCSD